MGLDLVLYTAQKSIDDGPKLAYGRKTWAIEGFFEQRCKMTAPRSYVFSITKEAWDEFINSLKPYMENKAFRTFIEEYNESDDSACYEVEEVIEHFLDNALENDRGYQLGPVWEAKFVLQWYDADVEVQKCFENNESVWMSASFQETTKGK